MDSIETETPDNEQKYGTLLVVDDDLVLAERLAISMNKRGFNAEFAVNIKEAVKKAKKIKPDYALVDLRIGNDSGLDLVCKLDEIVPDCRIVMLTAFGNIATAVAAIKSGAVDYLTKPADPSAIESALLCHDSGDSALPPPPIEPMTVDRVRWEHIQRVYEQCNRNVSQTARKLKMHRRSLQRILAKYAPKNNGDF